ncbi:MAG: TonB-dependent receptor [Bacteroidales bacterium]|nr:TonB-dependent receptor [Bacteroidales bacterium]
MQSKICAAAMVLCALCFISNTYAQTDTMPAVRLGTAVVKRSATERVRNTTQTIETADLDFITRNLGGSLSESLENIPGVSSINIGSGQGKPVIRGLSFNRVAVIEDNIKHQAQQWGSDHGLEIDQYALQNAQIIKGASSLEYGSDAIGGVIRLSTARVPMQHSIMADAMLTAKSSNRYFGATAGVSGRSDKFFASIRITAQDYADFCVPKDFVNIYSYRINLNNGRLRNTAGREYDANASFGYIANGWRHRVIVSDVNSYSGFFANAHGLEPRNVDQEAHDRSIRDILQPSQRVNHFRAAYNLERWTSEYTLSADLGYQNNYRTESSPYVSHGYMPLTCPETYKGDPNIEYEYNKDVYTAGVKSSFMVGKIAVKTGLQSEYQHNKIGGRGFIIPSFNSLQSGIYASADYRLTNVGYHINSIIFEGGIRYDLGHLETEPYSDWFKSEGEYVQRAKAIDRNFNDISWLLGATLQSGNFTFKTNIGKSFRIPSAQELACNGVNYHHFSYEKGNPDLHSESSYQIDGEICYSSRLWMFVFSPFAGYFDNYIFLNPSPNFDRLYGCGNQIYNYQECSVMRQGGEFTIKFCADNREVPGHNGKIEAEAAMEYVKARQTSGSKKGYGLPFAPPPSIRLSTEYTRVITKKMEASIGAEGKAVAKQSDIVPPENSTDGYFTTGISAGVTLKQSNRSISISMRINNLLNTEYYEHTSFYRLINLPAQGRNIIINLSLNL